MVQSFADAVELVDDVIRSSEVLRRLGYGASVREIVEETKILPPRCLFTFVPGVHRKLVIRFCYQPNGRHYFTVEVFNTADGDSFLIEEWIAAKGVKHEIYPFMLSAYSGTERERLVGFAAFLEKQLSTDELLDVLSGRVWRHLPFNWGGLK